MEQMKAEKQALVAESLAQQTSLQNKLEQFDKQNKTLEKSMELLDEKLEAAQEELVTKQK